jgi:hypothetical protein
VGARPRRARIEWVALYRPPWRKNFALKTPPRWKKKAAHPPA